MVSRVERLARSSVSSLVAERVRAEHALRHLAQQLSVKSIR